MLAELYLEDSPGRDQNLAAGEEFLITGWQNSIWKTALAETRTWQMLQTFLLPGWQNSNCKAALAEAITWIIFQYQRQTSTWKAALATTITWQLVVNF
jgi:hypothetical protein